jgi:lysophospholipase L1-like esterase/pimeloyl-ACP methyl ester carboxylesterase
MPYQFLENRKFLRMPALWCGFLVCLFGLTGDESQAADAQRVRIACLGDSITQGARVDEETQSYPSRLQELLGDRYEVGNFGVGGATLLRSGRPNIWSKLDEVTSFNPHGVIISLGTNDTVDGNRGNWSRIRRFEPDCLELLETLLALPAQPQIWLCGPTSMVLETPDLSEDRRANLEERRPRLEQLRAVLRRTVETFDHPRVHFLDLGPVLHGQPELLTKEDGVHPNVEGYLAIARNVTQAVRKGYQDQWPEEKVDHWHGYRRHHFMVAGQSAWVVRPLKAAPNRPWIWRARFPGFHAEMDLQMIGHGFHVAYVDVAGFYGNARAMEIGDALYARLTQDHQLSPTPVLEGVSRGGLFVYHWAARHPESVSAIYCDTPVCDPRSWPGGRGSGIGSPGDWNRFMEVNQLKSDQMDTFEPETFEKAAVIAGARIPVMHVISENDTVVPPSENTLVLKTRLEALGHGMELIRVPFGTEPSHGHHFTHPEPDRVVRFMLNHAK